MNDLTTQAVMLPDTIEDLSKFVLVGREKLASVRAEIRAIDKVGLAQEVRNQKREEAQMLSEALLDAETQLGDLLRQIPKAPGGRPLKEKTTDSAVPSFKKSKKEVIQELGLSEKQAQRFETLADNKDLVEQVKQEARENDDLPTRTRVIDLAQQRKKKEAEEQEQQTDFYTYMDDCARLARSYNKAMYAFLMIKADEKELKMIKDVLAGLPGKLTAQSYLREIDDTMGKLVRIRNLMRGVISDEEKKDTRS